MKRQFLTAIACLLATMAPSSSVIAHHNTQSEFGAFTSPTVYVEGKLVKVVWANPHIMMHFEVTGGDVPAGAKWRLVSHPLRVMMDYGFVKSDFNVGDTLKLHGWTHTRKMPLLWLRAVQINDGPMRSTLRFTDMFDIANGTFATKNIVPPETLSGSSPVRAGAETTEKLGAMGLLDSDGMVIWPPPETSD